MNTDQQGRTQNKSHSFGYLLVYFLLSLSSWLLTNKASAVASVWVGPLLFGNFTVALRLSHNLAHLFVMGQEATLLMYLSKYYNDRVKQSGLVRWIVHATCKKTIVLLLFVGIMLITPYPAPLHIERHYWISFLSIPFVVACGIYERFFLYLKSFFTSFLARGIYQPILFIGVIYFIAKHNPPSPNAALYTYTITFMIAAIIYALQAYYSGFSISDEQDQSDIPIWRRAGLFYTFSTLIIKSTPSIALLFLERLGHYEVSVGHFGAICNLIYGFHLLTKPFDSYLKPSIADLHSKGQIEALQHKLNYVNKIRYGIIFILLISISVLGKTFLAQYGPSYITAYQPFLLLASFSFIQYLGQPSHELLNYTGHQKQLSIIMAIQFFSIALLSRLLIPSYDIWGAVIAQGLPCVIATFASAFTLRKKTSIKAYIFF